MWVLSQVIFIKATLQSSLLLPAHSHSQTCKKQAKQTFLKVFLVLFCFDSVTHLKVLTPNRTGEMAVNWGMEQDLLLYSYSIITLEGTSEQRSFIMVTRE